MAPSPRAKVDPEMKPQAQGYDHIARLLQALDPWLNQVVIIGGWAHRFYRLHPLSQPLEFAPLTTLDTDIAVPERLIVVEQNLHERLKARGFKEEFLGEHRPPVTHYCLEGDAGGFYAEFLTPLIGGVENRGKPTATVTVAGVTSQKLRYLELLLHAPWHITLDEAAGFPLEQSLTIQIPSAASYLAQKILIHDKRAASERGKHIMYIHDTIQTFGGSLNRLHSEWAENVKPMLPKNAAARVINGAEAFFAEVTDAIRNASIEARATGRDLPPDQIRAVCMAGLKHIFV